MREEFKVLVVSTAHLKRSDINLMLKQHGTIDHPFQGLGRNLAHVHLNPATDAYGFWVFTGYVEDGTADYFVESGYSSEFYTILECAFKEGYRYVRFDEDAQYDENWEVFEWELEDINHG
jgi:hypothetical protein